MSLQQSALHETFLKTINLTISDQTIDELEHNLLSIIDILNPSIHRPIQNKHKQNIHEFIKNGYHIQLLKHLFSSYLILNKQWNNSKKHKLIFKLILSVQIPPHIIIDCLITLWKTFVSQNIDTEQPSYSISIKQHYAIIANDIIFCMKQLLSKQSHLMIVLSDWGSQITEFTNKYLVEPQCEANIRCIVNLNDLFAPYFYLYRDYFGSLTSLTNNQTENILFENYKFFQRKALIKYLIQTSFTILTQYIIDKQLNNFKIAQNKHLENLCKGIAAFCSILVRTGYVEMLNKAMINFIKQAQAHSSTTNININIISVLIECLSKLPAFEKWFESFLIILSNDEYHSMSYIENIKLMIHLLRKILTPRNGSTQIEYLLSHKFIINKTMPLHTMDYIIALLNYLTLDNELLDDVADNESDDGHNAIMLETIKDIGNVWGNKTFVLTSTAKQQQYITRALVLLIEFIIQRLKLLNKMEQAADLIPFLFKGVQSRFSSDIIEIRHCGMIVAQQYSKVFPNTNALTFGADLSNVFTVENCKFKCCDIANVIDIIHACNRNKIDYNFECILLAHGSEADEKKHVPEEEEKDIVTAYVGNEATVDRAWLDAMRKQTAAEEDADDANVWSTDSDDDAGNNEDSELEPYSLSDDEEDLRKVGLPSYIADCLDLLNSKDNADKIESGLVAAHTLIRNNPSDLKHCCVALCRILLHLQNEYKIADFAIYKRSALVSLIVVCPAEILHFLPQQLYTKEWSVGVKLEILTVLVDAAREMGNLSALNERYTGFGVDGKGKKKKKGDEMKVDGNDLSIITQNQSIAEKERWKIIDARIAMKTKRWASKPKHVPLKENKFSTVATQFVYPILNGYNDNESFLFDFPVLHTRILFTLGCCIECSGKYGIHTLTIAKDIFDLVLAIYFHHKLQEIRRTAVFVLSRILLHVPAYILQEENWFISQLNGLVENLFTMTSHDTDFATRDLAKLCLNQLKELFH